MISTGIYLATWVLLLLVCPDSDTLIDSRNFDLLSSSFSDGDVGGHVFTRERWLDGESKSKLSGVRVEGQILSYRSRATAT